MLFRAANLSFHFIFIYSVNSWASNRHGDQKCWVFLLGSATDGRYLLIFDWKLQFFNESKIVAWKRIVLSTNTLIQEQSPVPRSPWILLIEKCTTVCLYISEQMTINEYFLFAIGDSHQFARNSEITFLLEKKGARKRILLFTLNQRLHKILKKV